MGDYQTATMERRMNHIPCQSFRLADGILREPNAGSPGIVLWLPGELHGGNRRWQRIGTVPGALVSALHGLCYVAATSVPVQQPIRGWLARLLRRLGRLGRWSSSADESVWILPDGQVATQCGERQTGMLLVWPEPPGQSLSDEEIRRHFPDSLRQRIGENLFVLAADCSPSRAGSDSSSACQQAEEQLSSARRCGNRRSEAVALTDLAIAHLREGASQQAVHILQSAWQLARQAADESLETDVVANLGQAFLHDGQPGCAIKLLEQALVRARAAANRFQEVSVLDHLGAAHSQLRNPAGAMLFYEQALTLASVLGARRQQADLQWQLAIQKADIGLRDEAHAWAQAAIHLLEELRDPKALWFSHNLNKFREDATTPLSPSGNGRSVSFGLFVDHGGQATPASQPQDTATGPGILRLAMSATTAMAKFLGSGLKTVTADIQRDRLMSCARCEHHTGMRCRICGCFTKAKSLLPFERCPLGKWPD